MPCGGTKTLEKLRLEDLSEFEVYLPLRIAQALCIHAIESVPQIDAEWSERSHDRTAHADSAEQPRWVEVRRLRPEVASIVERVHVQHLIEAHAELGALRVEHVAERGARRCVRARLWD